MREGVREGERERMLGSSCEIATLRASAAACVTPTLTSGASDREKEIARQRVRERDGENSGEVKVAAA